ncbi:phosphonate metabolism protein/1,5-bisphosphokinase (PRPP-forming) PhnN [Aquabacter cavernae]|uniref:phosphonate metabolism protein/1,5-bisphosphokinase (PRPP-forming) PhnN n=1 Tax=Aquabacter cavernae TaxID=2496029 RepID=UPI000F8C61AC|nr:phosphonate metabolism protein/1,5-bisphosphokinase (PRPP-forming) PhnN [Aquabacter cavernae]
MSPPFGPGALILVVGPSGAGKDTLIDSARAILADRSDIHVARRLVTREPGAGEAHGTLSRTEFEARRAGFPLSWDAHGLSYALDEDVGRQLARGETVIANGSRAALPVARRRFSHVLVVHVTAPPAVRARRLAARGRESEADILERLSRAPALDIAPDLEIENVGTPEEGGRRLADFVQRAAAAASLTVVLDPGGPQSR